MGKESLRGWVDPKDSGVGGDAPVQAVAQADAAFQVEPPVGVVPIFHVGGHFQQPAHEIFPGRHGHRGDQVEQEEVLGELLKPQHHDHDAEAVDGADGAFQEPAKDKAPFRDGAESSLHAPAQEGVPQKVEHQQGQGDTGAGHVVDCLDGCHRSPLRFIQQYGKHCVVQRFRMLLESLGELGRLLSVRHCHLQGEQIAGVIVND